MSMLASLAWAQPYGWLTAAWHQNEEAQWNEMVYPVRKLPSSWLALASRSCSCAAGQQLPSRWKPIPLLRRNRRLASAAAATSWRRWPETWLPAATTYQSSLAEEYTWKPSWRTSRLAGESVPAATGLSSARSWPGVSHRSAWRNAARRPG